MSRHRVIAVAGVLGVVTAAFGYRLADLQLTPDPRLQSVGTPLSQDPIAAPRGEIVDRFGRALALSLPMPTVIADPRLIAADDVDAAVARLAPLLSTSPEVLTERLTSDRAFAYLERQVDPEVGEAIEALAIPGIWLVEEPRRENPNGSCSGLGVVGRVDTDHIGISGLEKAHDEALQGVQGELVYEASADGSFTIPGGREVITPAQPGADLQLTIDRNVQYRAEQLLSEYVERAEGDLGIVIVGVPDTGEILAMANVERDEETGEVACTTTNLAVTWSFEPGSIMKPLTIAGVVDAGVHGSQQPLDVPGAITRGEGDDAHEYRDHWLHDTMTMTPSSVLAQSSNVGTILLAEDLGPDGLHRTLRDFGLGARTALELPGEARGILDSLDTHVLELSNVAIGQSVSVTAAQMHQAYGTIANEGVEVEPVVIAADLAERPTRRVVERPTATAVLDMMREVVSDGTGTAAGVPGYHVAGKTGTAWQVCPDTGTYWCVDGLRHYTPTFAGIVSNDLGPVLSITVVIDDAKGEFRSGGQATAPLFAELAGYTLRQLRIPPASPSAAPTERVRADPAQVAGPAVEPESAS